MPKAECVNRRDFVSRIMRQCGLSYVRASQVFNCLCDVVGDAVIHGNAVRLGRVGLLKPVRHSPKTVHKGFIMGPKREIIKNRHVYFMDSRLSWRLKVYRTFIDSHSLHWYTDHWPIDRDPAEAPNPET